MPAYTNRYEIKYLVPSAKIPEVRETLSGFFDCDPNGDGSGAYVNYSIYFDSGNYRFYNEKKEGEQIRIKPRIRLYRRSPTAPPSAMFLELKGRYERIVEKRRVPIDQDLAERLLSPGPLRLTPAETQSSVLAEFSYLHQRYALRPVNTVVYYRTAFNGRFQNDLRMTFDEELRCSLATDLTIAPSQTLVVVPPTQFILELKYSGKVSGLLLSKLRRLGLEQQTLSKFALSMEKSHDQMRDNLLMAGELRGPARSSLRFWDFGGRRLSPVETGNDSSAGQKVAEIGQPVAPPQRDLAKVQPAEARREVADGLPAAYGDRHQQDLRDRTRPEEEIRR